MVTQPFKERVATVVLFGTKMAAWIVYDRAYRYYTRIPHVHGSMSITYNIRLAIITFYPGSVWICVWVCVLLAAALANDNDRINWIHTYKAQNSLQVYGLMRFLLLLLLLVFPSFFSPFTAICIYFSVLIREQNAGQVLKWLDCRQGILM